MADEPSLPATFAQNEAAQKVANLAQSEALQMLNQLMNVILNKDVPESRIDRLVALHEKLVADQKRMWFVEAMALVAPKLPEIDKNGKIVMYSKAVRQEIERLHGEIPEGARPMQTTAYAKHDDIVSAVRGPLSEHGLVLGFEPGKKDDGRITMVAKLSHVGGHVEKVDVPHVEVDSSGSKNNLQGMGSSLRYLMRYGTLLLLPIVTRDPQNGLDNDGAGGAPFDEPETISEAQYRKLADEIGAQGGPKVLASVLEHFRIEALGDLPAARFDEAKDRLAARAARVRQGGNR
jgi:hypothetical protein